MEKNKQVIDGQEEIKDQQEQKEIKTYSEEEVQKMLQSETDRKVSKALETAKAKWQKEFEAKLQQEKSEAEKLAKMSEAERMQLEFEKQKQAFEEERKAFQKQQLEMQTVKELSAVGLPVEFTSFVVADTAEQIKTNIENLKITFEKAIEKAVNEKLQGVTPKVATKQSGGTVTKEQFKKMSYQERMALYEIDPDLYHELKK